MTNTVKTIEAARDALVARVKDLPKQITELQGRVQTLVKDINLDDVKTLPEKVANRMKAIDLPELKIELPSLDTTKAFAPIDFSAIQAMSKDLQGRLVEIPALLQSFMAEVPAATSKFVTDTTTKARTITEQVSIFGFSTRKPAAKKPATKKPAAKKPAAKKPAAKKPAAKKPAAKKPAAKATPTVPPVVLDAPVNGNGLATSTEFDTSN